MDLWLMGRSTPLNIRGLNYTLERIEAMMQLYSWSDWPNFFPVHFLRVSEGEKALVLDEKNLCIYATPVQHFLPNMGLRIELKAEEKSIVYSCDTEPCPEMERLAQGADILLHEASGLFAGHSSAAQAGDVARRAEVGALYLIHYPTGRYASGDPVAEAKTRFPGNVQLARDFMEIDLDNKRPRP
jgi:ribonuclease Z